MRDSLKNLFSSRLIGIIILLLIVGLVIVPAFGQFVYILETIEEQEVGVRFRGGRIYDIVGPGVYSDVGLFVRLERVSSQAVTFEVLDEEIITKDKQRIGVGVSGDIFRPGLAQKDILHSLWAQYRNLYLDDAAVRARVEDLAQQSMKVCVGDRTFDANIIGTSRDELRTCIDEELSELAAQFGLQIENVVVPEVILSPEVQAALDAIVASRLATEKAAQDQLKAEAEALAEQARQEGEIRVEQSRIQEQTRQQTLLAQLEQQRLQAQLSIIEAERANALAQLETERATLEAQKNNELLAAERDLEINQLLTEIAAVKAQAQVAFDLALAELYSSNSAYLDLQIAQANANALANANTIIFTPAGTVPTIIMPGPGVTPTIDVPAAGDGTTPF